MIMLQGSREDSLDQRRVNIGYSQYKRVGYPKNFKADLYEDGFYEKINIAEQKRQILIKR